MSKSESNLRCVNNSGAGFMSLLTLLFIHHKLIGTITWSWWWVLSPLWITVLVIIVAAVIVGIIAKA